MSSPPRGVLTGAVASNTGPVEHDFDPAPDTARGLGLSRPQRLEHFHHERGVDRLHWMSAENWRHVSGKRVGPLLKMLRMAPCRTVRVDVGSRAIVERHRARGLDALCRALGLALIDWIGLIDEQQPMFGRLPARIGEGQLGEPA